MPSFNKVILVGNLTRDPEFKVLPNQTAVCSFGMAMNRKWKSADGQAKEEVCFVDCTAFAKVAEIINQYVKKGNPLMIEGRLRLEQWEDKQTGQKRSKLSVVVENMQLMGGKPDGNGNGNGGQKQTTEASSDSSDMPF
jgi:single-strand DNA-binding protein